MYKLFISYSSKDRDFAMRLAEDLKRGGYDIWLDRWKISGRQPYWDEIQTGIENCTHFLFIVSPDSIEKTSGARKELYHAGGIKPAPQIVPIMARETPFNRFPILISPGEYQIHDFATQPYDTAFADVVEAIQRPATGAFPVVPSGGIPTRPVPTGQRGQSASTPAPASRQPYEQPLRQGPASRSQIKPWQIGIGVLGAGGVAIVMLAVLVFGLLSNRKAANGPTSTPTIFVTPNIRTRAAMTLTAQVAPPLNDDDKTLMAIVDGQHTQTAKMLTAAAPTQFVEATMPLATSTALVLVTADGGDNGLVMVTPVDKTTYVNIRTGPATNYPPIGVLKKGNQLQAIGRADNFQWLVVNFNGKAGWMAVDVLVISGDWGSLPVVTTPPSPTPSNTPIPTDVPPTEIPTATPTASGGGINFNSTFVIITSPCSSPQPSQLKVGIDGKSVVNYDLKMWSDTTTSAKSVGTLISGEQFTVTDGPTCLKNIPYWQIKTNNEIGWVPEMGSNDYYIAPVK